MQEIHSHKKYNKSYKIKVKIVAFSSRAEPKSHFYSFLQAKGIKGKNNSINPEKGEKKEAKM